MSDLLEKIKSINSTKYCNGLVSIAYRTNKADYDINKDNYVLNGDNDGWFRKINGSAKGHGICINKFSVTSSTPVYVGDFLCYKCKIDYTSNNFNSTEEQDLFWLFVHHNIDVWEVVDYIQSNKENWKP